MKLHRRTLVRTVGLTIVGGVAGCSAVESDRDSPTPESEGETAAQTDRDGTSTPETTLTPASSTESAVTSESPMPAVTRSPTETDTASTTAVSTPGQVPQSSKLLPESVATNDRMGNDVALSGDGRTAIVGAVGDVTTAADDGRAYVFSLVNGTWTQRASFAPDSEDSPGLFGFSVAMAGDGSTALVGVPAGARSGDSIPGTVYVVSKEDGTWQRGAKLTSADERPSERFGLSLSLSADGQRALVGSNQASGTPDAYLDGAVHVLEKRDGSWESRTRVTAEDSENAHQFGLAAELSADGDTALVGVKEVNGDSEAITGYVFTDGDDGWTQQGRLVPEETLAVGRVTNRVALSGDGTVAFVDSAGGTSVFETDGTSWNHQTTVRPESVDSGSGFGKSVAVSTDGTTAIVGSRLGGESANGENVGSVHLLHNDGSEWVQREQFTQVDGRQYGDAFGSSLAVSADGTVGLVGATRDQQQGLTSGAAYVLGL